MKKFRRLIFCCLLLVVNSWSRSAIPASASDELIETMVTVQSRRDALARLIAERDQLLQAGDRVSLVKVSNQIAELHLKLCDLDSALTATVSSLDVARQFSGTTDATLLVDTLVLSGRSYIRRNEIEKSVLRLNEALELSQALRYADGEAQSLAQLAVAEFELGKHSDAERTNNQALQIWQRQQNKRGEAQALSTQGVIYIVLDQVEQATATLKTAETLWRALGDSDELANTLVDQNFLATRQGQWQAALTLLNEAQGLLVEKEAEPYVAGKIAMSFGDVYEAYGQLDTSLGYFREALTLYRDSANDKRAVIDAANQVGRLQARLGNYATAQQEIGQALNAALETGNELNIGMCHETLGRVWLEAGDYEPARDEFQIAINHFQKINGPWLIARAQTYLGQTEHLLGNLARAAQAYENALRFYRTTPDYTNEAVLRFGLGKLALQQGQLSKAEEHLRRSIELTEQLRLNAASRELRSSFLASIHARYETYVEWLMTRYAREHNQQFAIKAFEANESGRARALLDSLRDSRELRQTNDPMLLVKEEKLQQQEQKLIDERARLASHGGSEQERAEVEKELIDVRAQYETLEARLNSSSNFDQLLQPLSYENIRNQVTDAETSLLSYSLGDGKSFAWLITQDGFTSYELANKHTIEKAANRLLALLKSPPVNSMEETELQSAIGEVSRLVLQPVSTNLRTPRLVVIGDGALQYIPFQILRNPAKANEPLISGFDVVTAPSASTLALVRQKRANRRHGSKLLVGFGDAVFSRDYIPQGSKEPVEIESGSARSEPVSRLKKLPRVFNAKRELLAISDLVGNDSSFYTEYNATRDNLLKLDLSQYRILHVVTHGVLDTNQPELSGLVLSLIDANQRPIDGFVSLADIYRLRAPLDLVVLSACHTAVGQRMQGEGLIGLTRGFMYAGASGVVATLWRVDDKATAELMKHFYANMLQHGMRPPRALREAQNYIRSQPGWSAPYFWAGFTFQGDYDLTISAPIAHERNYLKFVAAGTLIVLVAAVLMLWLWRSRRKTRTQTIQH